MKEISSLKNPLVKQVMQLQEKARSRRETSRFVIEGRREIQLALTGGYELETLFWVPEWGELPHEIHAPEVIRVDAGVYRKMAYREGTEGLLAIAKTKSLGLEALNLGENPLILVAEALEKPGNIGALLRTADAAGVDAVFIANPPGDMYNPNIVRSSVGCLFTVPIATGNSDEMIEFLQQRGINIYAAALQNATDYSRQNFTGPCAIAVGTEATGLTQAWRDAAIQNIAIPMSGAIDSMNVSVAAAVLVFEAKRQRNS